jgi:hypothetical protein
MEYRLRNLKCAIWANPQDGGVWYSVTFSRSYKDGEGNWKSASSFGGTDCLLVAELARLAFHWIAQQHASGSGGPAPVNGGGASSGQPD